MVGAGQTELLEVVGTGLTEVGTAELLRVTVLEGTWVSLELGVTVAVDEL